MKKIFNKVKKIITGKKVEKTIIGYLNDRQGNPVVYVIRMDRGDGFTWYEVQEVGRKFREGFKTSSDAIGYARKYAQQFWA